MPQGSDQGSAAATASSTMRIPTTTGNDEMDVDTAIGSSSTGKRKHSEILLHDDGSGHHDTQAHNFSFDLNTFPPSSDPNSQIFLAPSASSALSAPSVFSVSVHNAVIPSKKKKTAPSRDSTGHLSSSVVALPVSPSGNIAMKITPAVAIHGMQGTLNRLTDIMEQNIHIGSPTAGPSSLPDPVSTIRTQAIKLLQARDDGLLTSQKTKLIQKFTKDIDQVKVYVALDDDELRRNWLQEMLDSDD